ncbi:SLAP domain-containing protein [Companilactobacillus sp. HBUAS56257]|uniref:SLAP domain-containing protein n=1 Tax=Companilactobacillus sp. HBUAS56257 TaxID=3109360 RepID=UPI002FF27476
MKKMRTVILTSILLSATVLGSNVSLIDAASKKSTPIKVTNELTKKEEILKVNNTLDSNISNLKFVPRYRLSSLENEFTFHVGIPYTSKDTYKSYLLNELGVVDDDLKPLDMKVISTDELHGFIDKVSYTDPSTDTTKIFNISYDAESPKLYDRLKDLLNFKYGSLMEKYRLIIEEGNNGSNLNLYNSSIEVLPGNTGDMMGNEESVKVSLLKGLDENFGESNSQVEFIAKNDLYDVPDTIITRKIRIFKEPDWSKVNDAIHLGDKDILNSALSLQDENGNNYNVKVINPESVDVNKTGNYNVNFRATGMVNANNEAKDYGTKESISYTKTIPITVSDDKSEVNYNYLVVDKKTGNTIASQSGSAADGTSITLDKANLPAGYTLTDAQKTFTVDAKNPTKVATVAKDVDYTITFVDKDSQEKVDQINDTGKEGESRLVTAPDGYTLDDSTDMIYTLDSTEPEKTILVSKSSILTQDLNYTIKYTDVDTDKVISEKKGTGKLGDQITAVAPDGYVITDLTSAGFTLAKDDDSFTCYVKKADTPYNVTYVDQDTDEEVGAQKGLGIVGEKITLKTPAGYTFVNANDATYQVDKDSPNTKVFVKQSTLTEDNLITTHPYQGYVEIYDENGKLNKDVVLSQNTDWATDQKKTIDGVDYYRVATNQYVKADSVYVYSPLTGVVTTSKVTPVYNSKGQLVLDRALDKDAPWYSDRISKIKGEKMYRVATDEWVKASDVTEQ